jgi:hypothetical protein
MDWIYLAQNSGQWQALVDTEMNLHIPELLGWLSNS